jgi:hypothetical protein
MYGGHLHLKSEDAPCPVDQELLLIGGIFIILTVIYRNGIFHHRQITGALHVRGLIKPELISDESQRVETRLTPMSSCVCVCVGGGGLSAFSSSIDLTLSQDCAVCFARRKEKLSVWRPELVNLCE